MNKMHRMEEHSKSRKIDHKDHDEYKNAQTITDVDTLVSDADVMKEMKRQNKKVSMTEHEGDPFTATDRLSFKNGGSCKPKKHMAVGGVAKMRHDQYYK